MNEQSRHRKDRLDEAGFSSEFSCTKVVHSTKGGQGYQQAPPMLEDCNGSTLGVADRKTDGSAVTVPVGSCQWAMLRRGFHYC